jgi:hypothetical protein
LGKQREENDLMKERVVFQMSSINMHLPLND